MRCLTSLAVVFLGSTAALAADGRRVWVAPFAEANDAASQPQQQPDWISRALHQSVVDDLASTEGISVSNGGNPTTRPADADYIVSGTVQRLNGELRVTGRVENMADKKLVGGFKATGGENDLFAIEDSIASQLKAALAPAAPGVAKPTATTTPIGMARAGSAFEGSDLQRALEDRNYLRRLQQGGYDEPQPTYGVTQPVYGYRSPFMLGSGGYYSSDDYYYPPYYPPYYNNGFGYGYGWWGGGSSVIIIDNNKRHHRHDHDGDGRHWDGGGGGGGGSIVAPAPLPAVAQNEAVRRAASWAGNPPSTEIHEINNPAPQWVPGGTPRNSGFGGGGPSRVSGGGGGGINAGLISGGNGGINAGLIGGGGGGGGGGGRGRGGR